MVSSVAAVAGATVSPPRLTALDQSNFSTTPGTGAPSSSNSLDKDAFLKLLVAQLKYQDPMKPSSSEEFIATTAQFTVVEKLDQLTQQGAATALVSSLTTASALVGRSVSAIQNGTPVDATVLRSKIVSGAVVLETDKGTIHLNEIVSVGPSTLAPQTPAGNSAAIPAPEPATPEAEPIIQTQEHKQ
jgi:flagellar basal-body rod modification protein FlgD